MSFGYKVRLLALFCILHLEAQSPITETSSYGQWDEKNRASLRHGEVYREDKILFKIERHGNVAFISPIVKPTPLQRGLWEFEIHSEGQNFFASWDKKRNAWKFNLMNKGKYDIYVSKRKSKVEKISYAWFTITN